MTRTVLLFGISLAALLALLKWAEYSFFAKDLALEAYIGIVGLVFTALGGWIGWKEKWAEAGMTTEQINAKAEGYAKNMELYKNPVIMAGMTLMEILPVGLIITLISALILKRK